MTVRPHLLAVVSAHGFGHFAQTALVLNELRRQMPEVRITLRTRLPQTLVRSRLPGDIELIPEAADFGMVMNSALDVDLIASAKRYREFHGHWAERVGVEAQRIASIKPDLVLANAPYLTLAGAHAAGIDSVGLCSLNWADIFADYFADMPGFHDIHQQMVEAYNRARFFFKPQPSMDMADFNNGVSVPPLAQLGNNVRDYLDRHWQLAPGEKLVFLVPGGISTPIPLEQWPRLAGVRWVASWSVESNRDDIFSFTDSQLSFTDLLCSCDVVVTKPGYGTIAEAVCNGKPVLFVKRGDWAEEPFIVDWLRQHGQALEISRDQFFYGDLQQAIDRVLSQPRPPLPEPLGARLVAEQIQRLF